MDIPHENPHNRGHLFLGLEKRDRCTPSHFYARVMEQKIFKLYIATIFQ
jgi:hypothetical protein